MPYETIKLSGGVNAELTATLNQAGIAASNLIRFKAGLPQKIGGWSRFFPSAVPSVPRMLHGWEDLEAKNHLGVGGDDYLGVITDGVLVDVTPQQNILSFSPNFSTTSGSDVVAITAPGALVGVGDAIFIQTPVSVGGIVLLGSYAVYEGNGSDVFRLRTATVAASTVQNGGALPVFSINSNSATITATLPSHGYAVGSTFPAIAPTALAGLTVQGFYSVSSIVDADNFQFTLPALAQFADKKTMNGGQAQIIDYLAPYLNDQNSGYGIGGYGEGGYGSGFTVGIHTGMHVPAPDWSLDNYGELLVACPKNGPIFLWGPTRGTLYAQAIVAAPLSSGGIFVAMPEQIIVAWGASVLGIRDPLLVRWCDVGDYNDWTASVTNQAGSFRLPRGSMIVGAMQASQQALIWTDLAIWSMQYVGPQFVFGFNEIAAGCGLIAQHAACEAGSAIFWMSQRGFYVLSGGSVQPIPCSVFDFIFQNLSATQTYKIRAAANSQFNEIAWYFPSTDAAENDSYVKLNTISGEWDYGALDRSAWIDQSVLGPPIGASPNTKLIYQHETSADADGQAIDSFFETGFFTIGEGEDWTFVDECMPDFKYGLFGHPQTATLAITIKGYDVPYGSARSYGPYQVSTTGNTRFSTRIRARYLSLRVESSDLGSFWRLGGIKFRAAPDGRANGGAAG